jgi:mannosyltransferase
VAGRWAFPLAAAGAVVAIVAPRLGRRPIWLDEAYTVGTTHDLVATWRGTGGTMALYYLVVWPIAQLTTDRVWIRLPSLVFAAAAVVVVHEVGRLVGGRRMAVAAAGTLAVSWSLSRYAVEARSYTLAMLLVSLSWLGLVGAARAGSEHEERRWWWLFVAATLLAPLAHGLAAAHFVSQVCFVLLAPDRRRWLRRCVPVAVALAAEGVLLFAIGAGEVANWIDPLRWSHVESFLHVLVGRGEALWVVGILAAAGVALAVTGAATGLARGREVPTADAWLRLVPVFWALGAPLLVIAVSLVRSYAEPRYVLGALPGVALLVGTALARIRPAPLAVAAWLVVAAALLQDQPRITTAGVEDWPALADRVAAEAQDGDRVLMPAKLRAPFDYAWAEGGGRPDLDPLSPTDPLGGVRRFYDPTPGTMRDRLLADPTETVWYVDRDIGRLDDVEALLSDPNVARRYRSTGPQAFDGELYLVRLEPRPG